MSSGYIRYGKLTARGANKSIVADSQEPPIVLGDGLDQPYQRVLQSLRQQKAKKTYCAPDDDVIQIGSAFGRRRKI